MSYCAGWRLGDTVYLVADVVGRAPLAALPRIGDAAATVDEPTPDSLPLNLVRLGPATAVGHSGDGPVAARLVEFLAEHHADAGDTAALFAALDAQLGPFDPDRPVALLLATSRADGSAELRRWTTAAGLDPTDGEFLQIGTPCAYHAALDARLRASLAAAALPPERLLPILTAAVRSAGVQEGLLDRDDSGLVFGLSTRLGEAGWQEDTAFVLYDEAFVAGTHVAALAREPVLVVHASTTDQIRTLARPGAMPPSRARSDAWLTPLRAEFEAARFRHWVFLGTSEPVITLVTRTDLDRPSDYLRVAGVRQGRFDLAFGPELTALLVHPLRERHAERLSLHLSVRDD